MHDTLVLLLATQQLPHQAGDSLSRPLWRCGDSISAAPRRSTAGDSIAVRRLNSCTTTMAAGTLALWLGRHDGWPGRAEQQGGLRIIADYSGL
jgi:hypothetical protein